MTGEAVKQRVREYMRSWEMTEPGDGILAGVSGGADSVCLLFLLDELKAELGIRLGGLPFKPWPAGSGGGPGRGLCEGDLRPPWRPSGSGP